MCVPGRQDSQCRVVNEIGTEATGQDVDSEGTSVQTDRGWARGLELELLVDSESRQGRGEDGGAGDDGSPRGGVSGVGGCGDCATTSCDRDCIEEGREEEV
jgi:hypothetical protein